MDITISSSLFFFFLLIKCIIFIRHLKLLLFLLSSSPGFSFLACFVKGLPSSSSSSSSSARLLFHSRAGCAALCRFSFLRLLLLSRGGLERSDLSVLGAFVSFQRFFSYVSSFPPFHSVRPNFFFEPIFSSFFMYLEEDEEEDEEKRLKKGKSIVNGESCAMRWSGLRLLRSSSPSTAFYIFIISSFAF